MSDEFDPYHVWLGIPADQQPPTHYRLLGIELLESSADVIDAAASRQTAYLHQIASGPNRKASQKILTEVAAARRILLNPESKAAYDQSLKAKESRQQAPAANPQPNPQPKKRAPDVSRSDSKVSTRGTKVFQCGKCKTRIRASASKAKNGLTCPKCKSQIRSATAETFAPIEIKPEPAGSGQAKKKARPPVWAHPAFMACGGTGLILLLAFAAIKFSGPSSGGTNVAEGQSASVTNDDLTSVAGGAGVGFDLNNPSGFHVAPPQEAASAVPAKAKTPAAPQSVVVVDDSRAKVTGRWESSTALPGYTGDGYRTTDDKAATISFPFAIRKSGNYEFRLKCRSHEENGTTVPVALQIGKAPTQTFVVNMKSPSASPGYQFLKVAYIAVGRKRPASGSVVLKAAGANGKVYADALEIVKRRPGDNGVIGFWSLDRLTGDKTSSDIGMVSATIQGAELVKGVIGKAAVIDADDTLRFPGSLIGANQGAIALWLRQDSEGAATFFRTEGAARISLRTSADGSLRVRIAKAADAAVIPTKQRLEPRKWYHLVATWKKGAGSVVYCNGKEIGRQKATPELKGVASVHLSLANNAAAKQSVAFDEIGFYRRLLAPNEVLSLFARRLPSP